MNHNPEAVFAALAALITRGEEVPAAAQALRVLPPAIWPRATRGRRRRRPRSGGLGQNHPGERPHQSRLY